MNKRLICLFLILIMALSALVACDNNNDTNIGGDGNGGGSTSTSTSSTLLDMPSSFDSKNGVDNLFIAHKKLIDAGSFSTISTGTSNSMGVNQTIATERTVVGENVFKQVVSKSSFVKIAEQRYVYDDSYILRQGKITSKGVSWDNSASNMTKDNFINTYGYTGGGLSGFILNEDSITSAKLISSSNGQYVYQYILDNDTATTNIAKEMRTSSGSSCDPVFTKACLTVTMDGSWNIISVATDHQYKVKLLVNFDCSEQVVETFSNIGEVEQLPEYDFFANYIGKDVEDDNFEGQTALNALLSMLMPYIGGSEVKPLPLDVIATSGNKAVLNGQLIAWLDLVNMDNTKVDLMLNDVDVWGEKINDISIQYDNADLAGGKIYLDCDNQFKASASVNGIMDAFGAVSTLLGGEGVGVSGGSISTDSFTDNMTLTIDGDTTIVSLVLDGDLPISIDVVGDSSSGLTKLREVNASIDSLLFNLTPTDDYSTITRSGEYADITPVISAITGDNATFDILAELSVGNRDIVINATAVLNLSNNTIWLQTELFGETLKVLVADNGVYVSYGQLKLHLNDISSITELLSVEQAQSSSANSQNIIGSILGGINATLTGSNVAISGDIFGLELNASITSADGQWNLGDISIGNDSISIVATPTDGNADTDSYLDDMGNLDEYPIIDNFIEGLVPTINAFSGDNYTMGLVGKIVAADSQINYSVDLTVDNNNMLLLVNGYLLGGDHIINSTITLYDNELFIDFNGIRASMDYSSLGEQTGSSGVGSFDVAGVLKEVKKLVPELSEIIDSVLLFIEGEDNIYLADMQFGGINSFSYDEDKNKIKLGLDLSENATASVLLEATVTDSGVNMAISSGDYELVGNMTVKASGIVEAPQESYLTNFEVTIGEDINLLVTVDTYNEELAVSGNIFADKVYASVIGGVVYIQYGNIDVMMDSSNLGDIAAAIQPLLELFGLSTDSEGVDQLLQFDFTKLLDMFTPGGSDNVFNAEFANGQLTIGFDNVSLTATLTDDGKFDVITLAVDSTIVELTLTDSTSDGADTVTTDNYVNIGQLALPVLEDILGDGTAYNVSGKVSVGISIMKLELDIDSYIDIVDGQVYVKLDINRGGSSKFLAYKDRGGYSYLLYNGKDNTIKLWCENNNYDTGWVDATTAFSDPMAVITSWFNVTDALAKLLNGAMESSDSADVTTASSDVVADDVALVSSADSDTMFSIDTFVKSFKCEDGKLVVSLDLSSINEALSTLDLTLDHNEDNSTLDITLSTKVLKIITMSANLSVGWYDGSKAYDEINK